MRKFYKKQVLSTCLLLMFSIMALAQIKVTGVVRDTEGQPMTGVTVTLKGTTNIVSTNTDGAFTINAPANGVLSMSFTGYTAKDVSINGKTNLVVALTSSIKALEEVVVVAYGTQKKVNLSGSVNTVSTKELVNRPVTSLTNALQGLVPGVSVVQSPGDVGSDIGSLNVRGPGNLGSSDPLYVVDGVPVTSDYFARINTNDVESISVLKDASASSIYGSRAAYGVIVVTTKKGKNGKMAINYNGYFGLQSPTILPHWLGATDYATLLNEAYTNAGRVPLFSNDALTKIKNHSDPDEYPDNDWYALTLKKNAPITEHEINISGGGKTSYFLSGSYFDQNSLLPGKSLQRYSFRSNVESQVSDKFKIGSNLSYIRDGYDNADGDISFTGLNREVPTMVNKQSNGDWGSVNGGVIDGTHAAGNPLRILDEGGRSSYVTNRFLGSVNGDYTPLKGLNINGMVTYNTYNDVSSTFTNTIDAVNNFYTGDPVPGTAVTPNQLKEYWETNNKLLTQLTASYEKALGNHYFKILGGASYEHYMDRFIQVVRKNFVNNNLNAINGGSSDPANTTATGDIYESGVQSFFGRLNYSFNNRYLLEGSVRSDASSQFAPGHRWGTYPSFSGAWRISQEDFMKNVHWVSELKLRGSWGKLGNINNVGYYDFYDGLNTATAAILDESKQDGVFPGKLANPTLSWERVTMSNIGLDAGLFDNKLTLQVDAFKRMTNGILLTDPSVPQEAGLGGNAPSVNLGKVQNKGVEVSLDYGSHIGGDFKFSVGGNFSRIWNKIVDLGGQDNLTYGSYFVDKVGQPIGSFYMYQAAGLFATAAEVAAHASQTTNTAAGDIKYIDQNNDKQINGDDRIIAGSNVPYITYGLHFTANYKRFDFGVAGQGVGGVKVYLEDEASQAFFNGAGVKEYVLDRWTPTNPNPNAAYPRILISTDNTQNLQQSTFWLFNADYFRVKSMTLGYTIPAYILDRAHIHSLRIYVSSNNPFTIRADKRLKDFDPEAPSARASYPQLKTYSLGVNLSL